MKATPIVSDYGSKDCAFCPDPTAVSRFKVSDLALQVLTANPETLFALYKGGVARLTYETKETIEEQIMTLTPEQAIAMGILGKEVVRIREEIAAGPMVRWIEQVRRLPAIVEAINSAGVFLPLHITGENSYAVVKDIAQKIQSSDANAVALKKIISPYLETLLADIDLLGPRL